MAMNRIESKVLNLESHILNSAVNRLKYLIAINRTKAGVNRAINRKLIAFFLSDSYQHE